MNDKAPSTVGAPADSKEQEDAQAMTQSMYAETVMMVVAIMATTMFGAVAWTVIAAWIGVAVTAALTSQAVARNEGNDASASLPATQSDAQLSPGQTVQLHLTMHLIPLGAGALLAGLLAALWQAVKLIAA